MSWLDALEVGSKVICSSPTNDFTIVTISSIASDTGRICANGRTYSGKTGRAIGRTNGSSNQWYYWSLLEPTEKRLVVAQQQARIYVAQFELANAIRALNVLRGTVSLEAVDACIDLSANVLKLVTDLNSPDL
jgi:hypothetical protein